MIDFFWFDLKNKKRGQIVELDVGGTANVKLMSYDSFTFYRIGLPYRYHGGRALSTPCRVQIPHDGAWILVVDTDLFGTFRVGRISVLDNQQAKSTIDTSKEEPAHPKELQAVEIKDDNEYDVFVCHASEDKDAVARPLVAALKTGGLKVWYDEDVLSIGNSLSQGIDSGLKQSNFSIIVVSKKFMQKPWVQRELKGITAGEVIKGKPILPILHGITIEEVYDFSPPLSDLLARSTKDYSVEAIAKEIIDVIAASKNYKR